MPAAFFLNEPTESYMSEVLYDIPIRTIDGQGTSLGAWRGKVLLVVNVASQCGLTPQYEGLEKLYEEKREDGLVVLGFPANNFGAQEPGTNSEIADFCATKFGVGFPMFEKISVKGPDQHPLYRSMIDARPHATEKPGSNFKAKLAGYGITQDDDRDVLWNFEKFLIGRNGEVVARFAPDVEPQDRILQQAIEQELA
jgi:glutathione peroxidase